MPDPDPIRPVGAGSVLGGRYRLVRLIAQGGMAAVWEAHDGVLARSVALKILHPHLAADQVFLERFRREAVSAARLSHPNVVATFDAGITSDSTAFIVMELIRGPTLSVFESEHRPLPGPVCVEIGKQIADALAHAHAAGLVHRDVKPANVMVCDSGTDGLPMVKVTDFGIAKAAEGLELELTKTGIVLGTPKYLSPEQIAGREPDARADIYALGLVLFEIIAGRAPFTGPTEMAVAVQHLNDEPPRLREFRPSVPPPLDALVAQMLAKQPEQRPQSALDVRRTLLAIEAQGRAARAGRAPGAPAAAFGPPGSGQGPFPVPGSSAAAAGLEAGAHGWPAAAAGSRAGPFPVPDTPAARRAVPEAPAGMHPVPAGGAKRPPVVAPVGPGVFVPSGSQAGAQGVAAAGPRAVPTDVVVAEPKPGASRAPAEGAGSPLDSPWPPGPPPMGAGSGGDWFAPGGSGAGSGALSPPPPPPRPSRSGEPRTPSEWPAGGRPRAAVAEYDPSSRRIQVAERTPASPRRHNSAGWLVAILVVAALIVVIIVASDHGSGTKPPLGLSTSVPATAPPVAIQNVSVFHLERDADQSGRVGNTIDGNPDTAWQTDIYNNSTFAGLRHGLGLAFTLGSSQVLHQLSVTSPTVGWSAEVFVANSVPDPPSMAPWGTPVAAHQGIDGSTVFDLSGHRGTAILLWITNLGSTDQTTIQEVTAS